MTFSLRRKIVAPFMALVLFTGLIGTAVVMTQLARTTTTAFDGTLVRAGSLASDHLAQLEAARVEQLRAAANTIGVPSAVASADTTTLAALLSPLIINAQPTPLTLTVVDRAGAPLLAIAGGSGRTTPTVTSHPGGTYAGQPAVTTVLSGISDQYGDKYVFLQNTASGLAVAWAAPIRAANAVVGAALISEPLGAIATGIRGAKQADVIFYTEAGHVLLSTLNGASDIAPSDVAAISEDHPARVNQQVAGHHVGVLVAPWTMRGRPVGLIGSAENADGLYDSLGQDAVILALIFAGLALLTIIVGLELARRITRPIERLATDMDAVAKGDLSRRTPPAGRDEIGILAESFNAMAAGLERKTNEVDEAYFSSLQALARAIDARDPYTFEHSTRVAALSLEIADGMAIDPEGRKALRRSGLLHDVGKIGVQDQILLKNGPLNTEEWAVIRRHPVIGFDMLRDIAFLKASLDGVRHHHERWDGTGYPDGLRGEAIPLQARIVCVADAFDAMTSDRAYRKGFSIDFAVRAVHNGAGTQFDPLVVKAFESRIEPIRERLQDLRKSPIPHAADIQWKEEEAA